MEHNVGGDNTSAALVKSHDGNIIVDARSGILIFDHGIHEGHTFGIIIAVVITIVIDDTEDEANHLGHCPKRTGHITHENVDEFIVNEECLGIIIIPNHIY